MGALHEGHASLIARAVRENDLAVVSIFVNPTQFGPQEDFGAYPRDEPADLAACERLGATMVFAPTVDELYPAGDATRVQPGPIAARLEGAARPGHFVGVATVLTKLFAIVRPDVAYFGQKDFQQLRVVQTVARDLRLAVRIAGCPTVRDPDGLAISSRNRYLSAEHRRSALATTIAEQRMAVPSEPTVEQVSLKERRGQALLGTITAAHFSHHVTNSLLNPLLPLIRNAFALSYAESGFAVSAFSIAAGLANAPWGLLADRIGSRVVIVGGLFLMGAASVALATTGSYWPLLALLAVPGIVAGSFHGPAAALIARMFSPRVRGTAMGMHITGGHLSFFAAPALAGILATATGTWRTPYIWFAAAPIVFGAM